MTQFGMQMPGGQQSHRAQPDVYTGLMLVAFLTLAAASAFVFLAGQRVGPDGNALGLQEQSVKLADMPSQ